MDKCIHAHHVTGENGEDLGHSCSFVPGKLYPTDATKCVSMCAHHFPYREPSPIRTNLERSMWLLAVAYVDRWGVPPEIELVP